MKRRTLKLSDKTLRKLQLEQLTLLIEFDRVCRMHDIKYIIDSGTLLGAVRHKGFIPWDDDADVRMLRSEYEKLCKVAADFGEDFFFQNHRTDKGYPWMYGKLRKNGTVAVRVGQEKLKMHQGIFLDIFVCDGVPDNKYLKKIRNGISFVNRKILYSNIAKDNAPTTAEKTFWQMMNFIDTDVPFAINSLLGKMFNENNCSRVGSNGYHHRVEVEGINKEWLINLTEVEFEGHMFYAPEDYDGFLSYFYGDYMQLPPAEEQKGNAELSYLKFKK